MRIAIVGAGIAGLVAARELHSIHDITLFEEANHIGGHTHTHVIEWDRATYTIDTGFIVFNTWTYPRFTQLMEQLGVKSQPSQMSFSVKCQNSGLEYNGTNINGLFAQRSNVLRPSFWRMLRDIKRFNHDGQNWLASPNCNRDLSLGAYLEQKNYSRELRDHYVLPMGAAIWSATRETMLQFPLEFFLRFFNNHGMLSISKRPQWRTISGGSHSYIPPLTAPFRDRILIGSPIEKVRRHANGVELYPRGEPSRSFDKVILATHSDQALAMLAQPTSLEQEILGSMPYQRNTAILHTDTAILPQRKPAWAAWNYHLCEEDQGQARLTYNMNILQNLQAPVTFCVTLNCQTAIDPSKVIKRMVYHHPIFTQKGVANQARHHEISGQNHTYFAGAYWFNGFHEDGVHSGQRVADQLREVVHA